MASCTKVTSWASAIRAEWESARTLPGSRRSQVRDEQKVEARQAREAGGGLCCLEVKHMLADGRRTWTSDAEAAEGVKHPEINRRRKEERTVGGQEQEQEQEQVDETR